MKKTKPNTTKALIHLSKNVLEHKINRKKQNPGSVAFYEIRPGNGAGLFSKEKKKEEISNDEVKKKDKWGKTQYKQANRHTHLTALCSGLPW